MKNTKQRQCTEPEESLVNNFVYLCNLYFCLCWMMERRNPKLFRGVSSGAHLRPAAHRLPVSDSPTTSAKEDTPVKRYYLL